MSRVKDMHPRTKSILMVVGMVAAVAQARPPTLIESVSRPILGPTAIAPDGQRIAYLKRETDWKNNEYIWQLWLFDRANGRNLQLTRGRKSISGPEWSPDGRVIAFVTEREPNALEPPPGDKDVDKSDSKEDKTRDPAKPAKRQIWMLAFDGGEAWQASNAETDVQKLHWSQDGHWIVFRAPMPESKADKIRKDRYSDYQVVDQDYTQQQLWRIDAAAARRGEAPVTAQALTHDTRFNVMDFTIAPDSKHIAFSAAPDSLFAHWGDQDLYLIDGDANAPPKRIVALPGPDRAPLFSPDGTRLAFETALGQANYFYANSHIAVVDLAKVESEAATAARDVRDLSAAFDGRPRLFGWRSNGIYFAGSRDGVGLYRMDPVNGNIAGLGPHDLICEDLSITPDGATLAWYGSDATHLSELYTSASATLAPQKLTNETGRVQDLTLGSVETVTWKSKDGIRIEGILHKPKDFDPKKKYPLLVKIHDGPLTQSLLELWPSDYAYPVQTFLAKGALILEPNCRGSDGFGAKFRALNVRNLGVGDMWDVMSGIDALIARGIVDPHRLGAMGWSEGGYISAFLTTHTDRFKAISVGGGPSDWNTVYVGTDATPWIPQYLQATPWDDPAIYFKTSPITNIKQARTPTLIQHGSNDPRVPIANAFELYRGLQDQHVDSRLIVYQGFGHRMDKPKSALALMRANLDWFSRYLWNEPLPQDSALYGTSEVAEAPK